MSTSHSMPSTAANAKHGHASAGVARKRSKTYVAWQSMISRCTLKSYCGYHRYGGRGIKVCDRWMGSQGFANFLADMGEKPEGMMLDRRDNDGNYEPENCRWVTPAASALNRSSSTLLTFGGETLPLSSWARRQGIQPGTVIARLREGWTVDDALTRPVQARRPKRGDV